ncbi:MAG TPA: response regulator [Longimicrobiales bacterium]|nr:response regulator [Longimicrobiales bacterium]
MRSLETKTVLIVEDEVGTRNLIARHLRRKGMEVTAVESGEAVLMDATRRTVAYDVVISDVHLPGMSGLDLATLILAGNARQPIVLITGDPDEALAREALSRGPVGYLLKPFEMSELEVAVQQAVERLKLGGATLPEADTAGRVPLRWLDIVDQQSYAGKGHARRVARVAMALAEAARSIEARLEVGELVVAAWSHELGRLSNDASDPVVVATEGARMLSELGCAAGVVEGVRHMHERYDGTGGPSRLAGEVIPAASQILAVADSLDHYAAAWLHAGKGAAEAVDRALGLVHVQSGGVFSPEVVKAAQAQHHRIVTICGEALSKAAGEDEAPAAGVA